MGSFKTTPCLSRSAPARIAASSLVRRSDWPPTNQLSRTWGSLIVTPDFPQTAGYRYPSVHCSEWVSQRGRSVPSTPKHKMHPPGLNRGARRQARPMASTRQTPWISSGTRRLSAGRQPQSNSDSPSKFTSGPRQTNGSDHWGSVKTTPNISGEWFSVEATASDPAAPPGRDLQQIMLIASFRADSSMSFLPVFLMLGFTSAKNHLLNFFVSGFRLETIREYSPERLTMMVSRGRPIASLKTTQCFSSSSWRLSDWRWSSRFNVAQERRSCA
jgi:hypothetical protein